MRKYFSIVIGLFVHVQLLNAQHDHHHREARPDSNFNKPEMKKGMPDHGHSGHDTAHPVSGINPSHAYSRNLPMSRNASGTAWNPDASPMYMWMVRAPRTDWMFHGNVFLRYTHTDLFSKSGRGSGMLDAPNWFMTMMNRRTGNKGLFNATAMISLDRLTEGGNGYPLLFQSGETWQGRRLVDRQHPHDLFSALSIGYTHMLNKDMDLFTYIGYPGEPALGAPAFMHRVSAMNDPDAPLGHHWQDATHITFGAATVGFRYRNFKLEASSFTGREPDENRFDFDRPRFNSYSYRLSYNPTRHWALQVSQGHIKEPEVLEPGVNIIRTTASVLFARQAGPGTHYSAALIWGLNDKGADHKEHSLLLENNYQFGKNALFGRYEFIQKSSEELDLGEELSHGTFPVHALSFGYNRSLIQKAGIELTAGSKLTVNFPATELKPLYGNLPIGFQVYIQFRPVLHRH